MGTNWQNWWLDAVIVALYFVVIAWLGLVVGRKKTGNLADFYVAGGNWGPLVSFIFVFASALAGNEAVVVSGQAYHSGLSGVWYWWSFLIVTPVYYLFAICYKRARVFNLAEYIEMRFSAGPASLFALLAGPLAILLCGTFLLAVGKILSGLTGIEVQGYVWSVAILVGLYVAAGGMMSTVLTDIVQGVMCLVFLSFMLLPFLFTEAGGWESFSLHARQNPELWQLTDAKMGPDSVFCLNLAALAGGIAYPSIFNWIAISKDEITATQCGWGHLWKRVITLVFALYGILFAILLPGLSDGEMAWGRVMDNVLPMGFKGLLVASFFAAVMSSAAASATTSSAMLVDYFYKKRIHPNATLAEMMNASRIWSGLAVLFAALSTLFISNIKDYIFLFMNLLSFMGIPILAGTFWHKPNVASAWLSLAGGVFGYLVSNVWMMQSLDIGWLEAIQQAFVPNVLISVASALLGLLVGTYFFKKPDRRQLERFFAILVTPIGREQDLALAGIQLPLMENRGIASIENPTRIPGEVYQSFSGNKWLGRESAWEFRSYPELKGFYKGFIWLCAACVALVLVTWLVPKWLFVW